MTACDACNEGFYCETGASAALPCKVTRTPTLTLTLTLALTLSRSRSRS